MALQGIFFIEENSDLMLAEMQTLTVFLKNQRTVLFELVRDVLLHSSEYFIPRHKVAVLEVFIQHFFFIQKSVYIFLASLPHSHYLTSSTPVLFFE